MADNANPNAPQDFNDDSSFRQKIESKEMISSLKDKIKLEGDFRDILKDSIREMSNMLRAMDKVNASIGTMSSSTINTKDIQREIKRVEEARYSNEVKMKDLQMSMGITREKAIETAKNYNKAIEQKITKELEHKRAVEDLSQFEVAANKKNIEYARNYQNYAELVEERRKSYEKAKESGNVRLQNFLEKDVDFMQKKLKGYENQLGEEGKSYLNLLNKTNLEKLELNTLNERIKLQTDALTKEELAYAEAYKRGELIEQNLKQNEKALEHEKETTKNLGISGDIARKFAEKLGIGDRVYEAMVRKSRELAKQDEYRKGLQSQYDKAIKEGNTERQKALGDELQKLGPQQTQMSKRLSTLKTGGLEAKDALKDMFKDPIGKGGIIAVVLMAVEKVLTGIGNAVRDAGNKLAGFSEHSTNVFRSLTKYVTDLIAKIPLVGGLIAGVVDGFAAFVDLAIGADDHIVKMGKDIGLSAQSARELNKHFVNMSFNLRNNRNEAMLTSEQYMKSYTQLAKNLEVNKGITDEEVRANAIMQKRLGLEEKTSSTLIETQKISGQNYKDIAAATLGQIDALHKATGVSFSYKDILKTAASYSGVLGLQFSKFPDKILRSVIQTKALGLELGKLNSMQSSLLDFETSISKEFEAQMLTGINLNLNAARNLALHNDMAGAAQEVARQVGGADRFLKMNRIQMEAIAAAAGMTVDEMSDMLRKQSYFEKLQVKDEKAYKNKLAYLRQANLSAEQLREQYRLGTEELEKMFEQSALEDFNDMINKLKQAFVDFATQSGIVEMVTGFIHDLTTHPEKMQKFFDGVRDFFATAAEAVASMTYGFLKIADIVTFGSINNKLIDKFEYMADTIGDRIRNVGKMSAEEIKKQQESGNIIKESGKEYLKDKETGKSSGIEVQQKKAIETTQSHEKRADFRNDMGTAGAVAGTALTAGLIGRWAGGAIGSLIGPWGTALGMGLGAIAGNWLGEKLGDWIGKGAQKVTGNYEEHAEGGVFTKATKLLDPKTGKKHIFGEKGPEILTPLNDNLLKSLKPEDKQGVYIQNFYQAGENKSKGGTFIEEIKGLFSKVKDGVKSVIPTSLFGGMKDVMNKTQQNSFASSVGMTSKDLLEKINNKKLPVPKENEDFAFGFPNLFNDVKRVFNNVKEMFSPKEENASYNIKTSGDVNFQTVSEKVAKLESAKFGNNNRREEVDSRKANEDKNIQIILNSTIKTNDYEIGKSSERYHYQFASSKIERSSGYGVPVGG